jgi:hypothetical protein
MTYLALGIFGETLKFKSLAMERYCRRAFTPVSPITFVTVALSLLQRENIAR